MAMKNWKTYGRRFLSILLAVMMVVGMVGTAFAQGTPSDPYDIGDIVYTANASTKPTGERPLLSKWEYQGMTDPVWGCGKEEHSHSYRCDYNYRTGSYNCGKEAHQHREGTCPVIEPAKAIWKLVENKDSALHLDIHIALTAIYTLDGVPYTANVELTKEDYTSGRLQITATAPFNITGTEIYDAGQRRFNGTFPVGTSDNPVHYTIVLTKDVDFKVNGKTVSVPMTFEKTVQFWSPDNICETIMQSNSNKSKWQQGEFVRGGMDFQLGASSASGTTKATLTIQKNVEGIALTEGKTFTFGVYSGNTKIDTLDVTVAAGSSTAITTIALPLNETYYVVEEGDNAISGYNLSTSVSVNGGTAANSTTSGSFTLTGNTAVVFTNTYTAIPKYFDLTVNYVDEAGNVLADQIVENDILENTPYTTEQKAIEGYTFERTEGDEPIGVMDSDKEVTYVYSRNPLYFDLVVNYVDEDGNVLADQIVETGILENTAYTTEQKAIEGYTFERTEGDEPIGVMDSDKEVTYVYSRNPVYFDLVVNYVDEDGNVLADQIVETGILENTTYTTEQKAIEGYTFERTEGDEPTGVMDSDKEVTYVYSRNPVYYNLTVNYVDEDGNVLADQIVETGILENTAYTTEQKAIEGYTFERTEGDAPSGVMDSDKEVTYVYSRNPLYFDLIVNYVDEDGNVLADQVVETGILENTAYTTEQKAIEGYTFERTEGDAPTGVMDSDKEVTYVYSRNPLYFDLIVNYVDEDGSVLADQVTMSGLLEGTEYTTEQKVIEGYTFERTEGDAPSGIMDSHKTVTYVYSRNPLYFDLVVNYVDEDGNVLADQVVETGILENTAYTTEQKVIDGYTFERTEGDEPTGIMDSNKEVTYVYSRNPLYFDLTVNYVDESGAPLAESIVRTGLLEGTAYTTSEKSISGYTFERTEGDAPAGVMDSDKVVTYVYSRNPVYYTLIVNYVDLNGKHIAEQIVEHGILENTTYTTEQKVIDGYTFERTEGDEPAGVMNGNKTVVYVYSEIPEPNRYTLIVNYVDENGAVLADPVVQHGLLEGTVYTTEQKVIDGYTFERTEGDEPAGIMNGNKTVVYVYSEIPEPNRYTLIVNYVDENGAVLADPVVQHSLLEGTEYTTEQKIIGGYTFERTEGDEPAGIMNSDKVVTYVYSRNPVYYTLTVNYVDESGNVLADQIVERGILENTAYATEQKTIKGYTFERTEGDAPAGIMNGNKTVTYVYSKDAVIIPEPPAPVNYTLTVRYVDESGTDLDEQIVEVYEAGSAYTTAKKEISGYVLSHVEGDAASGIMDGDKTVVYVYGKFVAPPVVIAIYCDLTVSYVDDEGNALAETIVESRKLGSVYYTVELAFEGYTFLSVEGDAASGIMDGDKAVTYVYTKDTPVDPPVDPVDPPVDPVDPPVDPVDPPVDPVEPPVDPVDPPVDPVDPPVDPSEPPVDPEDPEDPIEIEDPEVPLADVPTTGDPSILWMALTGISAAGLVGLGITRKKKED